MRLRIDEISRCLDITQNTLERWIRQGRIPIRKKGDLFLFSSSALKKWAKSNNLIFTMPGKQVFKKYEEELDNLVNSIQRGGVSFDVKGNTVEDVLKSAIEYIPLFTTQSQKQTLYDSLIAREKMMSTGIGKGIAIPHPRKPLEYKDIPSIITTCFLQRPIDYLSIDRQPVSVLFILICPTAKLHLHLLARLSFCLRDDAFLEFVVQKPTIEKLLEQITGFDNRFDAP